MNSIFSSFYQIASEKEDSQRRLFSLLRKAATLVAISSVLSGGVGFDNTSVWGEESTVSALTDRPQDVSVWQPSVEEACVRAEKEDKLLLLHFWAADSEACRTMERDFYGDANVVQQISKDYLCIPVNGAKNAELLKELGLPAKFPTDLVLTTNAEVLFSSEGCVETSVYLAELQRTATRYRQRRQNGMSETASASIATPDLASAEDAPIATEVIPLPSDDKMTDDVAMTDDVMLPMGASSESSTVSPTTPSSDEVTETAQKPAMESFNFGSMLTIPTMDDVKPDDVKPSDVKPDDVKPSDVKPDDDTTENMATSDNESVTVGVSENPTNVATSTTNALTDTPEYDDGIAPPDAVVATDGSTFPPPVNEAFTAEEMLILKSVPPLALDGYSPVSVAMDGVWNRGDVRYGAIHRGRTWLFTSEAEVKLFLEDPDRYAPVLAGYDVVAAVDQRQLTSGLREIAAESEGLIFLFASEENYETFCQNPEKYTQAAKRIVQESEMRAARAARHLGTSLFR